MSIPISLRQGMRTQAEYSWYFHCRSQINSKARRNAQNFDVRLNYVPRNTLIHDLGCLWRLNLLSMSQEVDLYFGARLNFKRLVRKRKILDYFNGKGITEIWTTIIDFFWRTLDTEVWKRFNWLLSAAQIGDRRDCIQSLITYNIAGLTVSSNMETHGALSHTTHKSMDPRLRFRLHKSAATASKEMKVSYYFRRSRNTTKAVDRRNGSTTSLNTSQSVGYPWTWRIMKEKPSRVCWIQF